MGTPRPEQKRIERWVSGQVETKGLRPRFAAYLIAAIDGKVIASVLVLGGLSLLAVVTGVVTSAFVTQAQEQRRAAGDDPVMRRLDELAEGLTSVQAELKAHQHDRD